MHFHQNQSYIHILKKTKTSLIPTSAFDVLAEERPWYSLLINVNKHVPLHPNDISKHKPINDSIEERTF